ncbi:MAG: regulator of PEP synthase PpsR (kinase-PPPase family) [Kiritimatiellia bacterium]
MTARKKAPASSTKKKGTAAKPDYVVHLISDSTGNLARHMLTAVLAEFPKERFAIVTHFDKHEASEIKTLVKGVRKSRSLVMHALVNSENKRIVDEYCEHKNIPHYDMTGSLVQFIADHTGFKPDDDLARLHRTDEGYFQRIRAMEFTAQHDDSRRLATAGRADIVILGLSRMTKSPTSTFLGFMGYKVANIALTREGGIPKEVLKISKKKMVGLTCQPKRLAEVRAKRFTEFNRQIEQAGQPELHYGNLREVIKEVMWVETNYKTLGIPVVDVTTNTIEETAGIILEVLKKQI